MVTVQPPMRPAPAPCVRCIQGSQPCQQRFEHPPLQIGVRQFAQGVAEGFGQPVDGFPLQRTLAFRLLRRQAASQSARWTSTSRRAADSPPHAAPRHPGEPRPATPRVISSAACRSPTGLRRDFGLLGLGLSLFQRRRDFLLAGSHGVEHRTIQNRFQQPTSSRKLTIWAATVNQSICMATGRWRR